MPPAVAAIASYVVVNSGWHLIVQFVLIMLINAASASYARSKIRRVDPSDDRRHVSRASDTPMVILYGERRISGPLVYWKAGTYGSYSEAIVFVVAFAEHEFEAIGDVYLGDKKGSGALQTGDAVTKYLGLDSQTVDSTVLNISKVNSGSAATWTTDFKGEGVAYVVVYLNSYKAWDKIPDISAIAKGSKIYDPRLDATYLYTSPTAQQLIDFPHRTNDDTTWEYSNNPVLVIRDYLTRADGFKEAHDKIDDVWTTSSANICDDLVTVPTGLYYPRDITVAQPPPSSTTQQNMYTCDLALALTDSRKENLEKLIMTMRGDVVYVGGKWKIMAGTYTTPVETITEDDVVRDFVVSQSTEAASSYNYITGTYYDKERFYQSVNFKPRKSTVFETRDNNRRIPRDIRYEGVTEEYQAQRLAIIELNESAHQTVVSFVVKPRLMDLHVNLLVKVTLDNPLWTDKVFRIISWELNEDMTIKLSLRDENSGTWDVALGDYDDIDPDETYNPYDKFGTVPPANLIFDTGSSTARMLPGGAIQAVARLTWNASTDEQLGGYRVRTRPVSIVTLLSAGYLETLLAIYFKADETTGTAAVGFGPKAMTGTYGTNVSGAGISVAGLGNEAGTAIAVDGNTNRMLTLSTTNAPVIVREFSVAIAFKINGATSNTTLIGQWGSTNTLKTFRLGTLVGSSNFGAAVRDDTLSLTELDSGSAYNDASAHLAILTLKNDILILEIDDIEVDTADMLGKTLIIDETLAYTIGGGVSGLAFNGTWDDAAIWNKSLSRYARTNFYSLWNSGTAALGLDDDWEEYFLASQTLIWERVLQDGRYYDFSVEAHNELGLFSSSVELLARQVVGSDIGPDQLGAITAKALLSGAEFSVDCTSVTNEDIAHVEWVLSPVDDRNDGDALSIIGDVPDAAVGIVSGIGSIEVAIAYSGTQFIWARLINTSGQTGAWNSLVTSGFSFTAGTAEIISNNLLRPVRLRGTFSVADGYIFHQGRPNVTWKNLSPMKLFVGDYVSCGTYMTNETSSSGTLVLEFLNSGKSLIAPDFRKTFVAADISSETRMVIEAAEIPVGSVYLRMSLELNAGLITISHTVINKGLLAIEAISPAADGLLDPNDTETSIGDLGDTQNLLSGSVEVAEENTATTDTTSGGGPYNIPPQSPGGGYYEEP